MSPMHFTPLTLSSDVDVDAAPHFKETEPVAPREVATVEEVAQEEKSEVTDYIEELPEAPKLSKEEVEAGVSTGGTITLSDNKTIELPIPLEKLDEGLHKPVSSGWRWLAESVKFLLKRFHLMVVTIHGKLTVKKR